jgi:DNA-directed RNA polymerase sigma subunit (sigma70/sigma32)
MTGEEIAETTGILKERVRYILHEELDMKKLYACSQQIKDPLA